MIRFIKSLLKPSTSIERVEQFDGDGCSIAALSMITGISYSELKITVPKLVSKLRNSKTSHIDYEGLGLHPGEYSKILHDQFDIKSRLIKFVSLSKLNRHCIIMIYPVELSYATVGHAVVYDARAKHVLDPLGDGSIDMDKYNIFGCLEILN